MDGEIEDSEDEQERVDLKERLNMQRVNFEE